MCSIWARMICLSVQIVWHFLLSEKISRDAINEGKWFPLDKNNHAKNFLLFTDWLPRRAHPWTHCIRCTPPNKRGRAVTLVPRTGVLSACKPTAFRFLDEAIDIRLLIRPIHQAYESLPSYRCNIELRCAEMRSSQRPAYQADKEEECWCVTNIIRVNVTLFDVPSIRQLNIDY